MDNETHNPDAGPFSQALELLQSIYSDTRHGILPHWSKQIDMVFFLRKHSPEFMRTAARTAPQSPSEPCLICGQVHAEVWPERYKRDAQSAREHEPTFQRTGAGEQA